MCVDAKKNFHICGFCVKLKSLLKFHLRQVYIQSKNRTPLKRKRYLPAQRHNIKTKDWYVGKHWNRLLMIKSENEDKEIDTFSEAYELFEQNSDLTTELKQGEQSDINIKGDVCQKTKTNNSNDENAIPKVKIEKCSEKSTSKRGTEFVCHVEGCGKTFKTGMVFRRHQTSHDKQRKYECNSCDARFKQEIHLTEHQLSHSKEKPFGCLCGKKFQTSRQLKKHRCQNEVTDCLVSDTEQSESDISPTKKFVHNKQSKREIVSKGKSTKRNEIKLKRTYRKGIKTARPSEATKDYVCTKCDKQFDNSECLNLHMKLHNGKKPYFCDYEGCTQRFVVKKSLQRHILTHCNPKNHLCSVCQLQFSEASELHEHMFVHSQNGNKPFMCFCGKYFLCAAKLREHEVVHNDARPFACHICSKAFKRAINLKEHMYIHQAHKPFVCHCGKKFAVAPLLKRHETRDHRNKLTESSNSKNVIYPCDICSATFKRKAFLYKHMKEHVVDKVYQCSQCRQEFLHKEQLTTHACTAEATSKGQNKSYQNIVFIKNESVKLEFLSAEDYDKKVKTFLCELCGKGYMNNSKLNEHRKTHTGELPFTCTECRKSFSEKYKLTNHMVTHNTSLEQRRKMPCEYCGRCFTTKVGLVNHIRTHTGEKPHKCPQCDYRSIQYASLQNHMATHSSTKNFECKQCKKRFKLKWSLVLHTKRHAGETKHACTICDKRFLTTSQLKKHLNVHSHNRLFECPTCNATFKREEALRSHIARNHIEPQSSSKSTIKRYLQPLLPQTGQQQQQSVPPQTSQHQLVHETGQLQTDQGLIVTEITELQTGQRQQQVVSEINPNLSEISSNQQSEISQNRQSEINSLTQLILTNQAHTLQSLLPMTSQNLQPLLSVTSQHAQQNLQETSEPKSSQYRQTVIPVTSLLPDTSQHLVITNAERSRLLLQALANQQQAYIEPQSQISHAARGEGQVQNALQSLDNLDALQIQQLFGSVGDKVNNVG